MTNKTIILVWTQKCKNFDINTDWKNGNNYWGLGDLIRGSIKLFQLSKKMGFKLIINHKLHPISMYLKKQDTEYDDLIINNKNNIEFIYPGQVENYINNSKNDILYFLTNDTCDENNITYECKHFIKNVLSPNDELVNLLNYYNYTDYNIIHMRVGDNKIKDKNLTDNTFIYNIKEKILNNLNNESNILVCDSYFLKEELINNNLFKNKNISCINLDVGHIGYEQNTEKIRNTLIEFFIITKSKKIKTYTVYSWISGFVFWISKIYDIPLEQIN
jgi:hypothetical protein